MTKTLREEIQEQLEWVWEQGRGFDTKHHDREYERALTKDKTAQILSLIKSHLKPLSYEEIAETIGHPMGYLDFAKDYMSKPRLVSQATIDKNIEEMEK